MLPKLAVLMLPARLGLRIIENQQAPRSTAPAASLTAPKQPQEPATGRGQGLSRAVRAVSVPLAWWRPWSHGGRPKRGVRAASGGLQPPRLRPPGRPLQDPAGPGRPDANGLAHETIREQTRQAGTGRDRETAKPLLGHTTADLLLRGEKGLERLRA